MPNRAFLLKLSLFFCLSLGTAGTIYANPCQQAFEFTGPLSEELDQPENTKDVKAYSTKIAELQKKAFEPIIEKLKEGFRDLDESSIHVHLRHLSRNNKVQIPMPYFSRYYPQGQYTENLNPYLPTTSYQLTLAMRWLMGEKLTHIENAQSKMENAFPDLIKTRDLLSTKVSAETKRQIFFYIWENTSVESWTIRNTSHLGTDALALLNEAKPYDNYLWSEANNYLGPHDLFELVPTPIGAYGPEFTKALIRTTQIMMWLALNFSTESAAKAMIQDKDFFQQYVVRGRNTVVLDYDNAPEARLEAPIQSVIEGILSINQLVALLTAERFQDLNEKEVVNMVSKKLVGPITGYFPMGLIGPMTVAGYYIPDIIGGDSENPVVRKDIIKLILQRKNSQRKKVVNTNKLNEGPVQGLGCPFARKDCGEEKSVVQFLAEVYGQIFQVVWDNMYGYK